MTPKFTTPCYVRIEDTDKRKEICEQLERIGYKNITHRWGGNVHTVFAYQYPMEGFDTPYFQQCTALDITHSEGSALKDKFIDCGTNTELFLALASMRSDTDKGQWFVYGTDDPRYSCRDWDWYLCDKHDLKNDDPYLRKATAAEITEHLKTKTI